MDLLQISWQLYLMLFSLMVVIPLLLAIILAMWNKAWIRYALWGVLSCTSAFLWSAWWLSANKVQIFENRLEMQAGFYQASIDNLAISPASVSVLDSQALGVFEPHINVNGIKLPEYQVGWYLLANRRLAFVMLIGESRQVSLVSTPAMTALVSGDLLKVTMSAGSP